jgi:hypothetical protein
MFNTNYLSVVIACEVEAAFGKVIGIDSCFGTLHIRVNSL